MVMDRAMHALTRLDRMEISEITPLVRSWLFKGANLPLAGPFVAQCLESVERWRDVAMQESTNGIDISSFESAGTAYVKPLLLNTQRPLAMSRDMTTAEFFAQILGKNLRWESLGIFFAAAARAAYDTPYFPPLYTTNEQRQKWNRSLTYIGDCCLDTCLALDCLNDLQLVLQYENCIVHSQVDGDQSGFPLGANGTY